MAQMRYSAEKIKMKMEFRRSIFTGIVVFVLINGIEINEFGIAEFLPQKNINKISRN